MSIDVNVFIFLFVRTGKHMIIKLGTHRELSIPAGSFAL